MATHFRIAQEHGIWNVYSSNRPARPEEQFPTLEQAERQVEEWTSNLTAGEEHIMDQIGYVSRYRMAPYADRGSTWAIFYRDNPKDTMPINGASTKEKGKAKLDKMDRADMAEIDSQEWAKQALTEWLNQVAAKYGLQPNEILSRISHLDSKCAEVNRQYSCLCGRYINCLPVTGL